MKQLSMFLLLSLWLTASFQLKAQGPSVTEDDPTYDILPPSPTVSELIKFIDFPVNYNSGTPSIDIPLHTLTGKGISVPISLSYHASGVKVNDISSNVGLGWSLNAGGVVSRTVMKLPDEGTDGFITRGSQVPHPIVTTNPGSNFSDLREFAVQDGWDGQPDIFHFSFPGYSGKFIIDGPNSIKLIPHQDLKVTYTVCNNCSTPLGATTTINSVTITAPNGVIYTFGTTGAIEYSETEKTGTNSICRQKEYTQPVATAWYLKKIHNPITDDDVTFTYSAKDIIYNFNYSETYTMPDVQPITPNCPDNFASYECMIAKRDYGGTIASISSTVNGTVEFVSDAVREDILTVTGDSRITGLLIKGPDNSTLKRIDFIQTVVTAANKPAYIADNRQKKRMFLDEIQTIDVSNSNDVVYKYQFEYLNRSTLPPRFAYAQDHWGYFNSNLSPQLAPGSNLSASDLSYLQNSYNFQAANREPDVNKAKIGVLNKVIYPTGGNVSYEYESNEVAVCGTVTELQNTVKAASAIYNGNVVTSETPFTIDEAQTVTLTYSALKVGFRDNGAQVKLIDVSNGNSLIFEWGGDNNLTVPQELLPTSTTQYLLPGNYKIVAIAREEDPFETPPFNNPEYANISVSFMESVSSTVDNEPTGGIRVKKVTYDDNDGDVNNNIIRTFHYEKDNNGCDASTATYLGRQPLYVTDEVTIITDPNPPNSTITCNSRRVSSSSMTNITSTSGSIVGYREVWEWHGENAENGKRYFKYRVFADGDELPGPNPFNVFLSTPKVDYSYKTGKLEEEATYDTSDDLVSRKTYTYEYDDTPNSDTIRAIVAKRVYDHPGLNHDNPLAIEEYAIDWYDVRTDWIYLESTTEEVYSSDGSGEMVATTTDYSYETQNGAHTMPIETLMTNSDGSVTKTVTEYVHDRPQLPGGGDPIKDDLIDANKIDLPLKTTVSVQEAGGSSFEMVSGIERTLDYFTSNTLPRVDSIKLYEKTWDASGSMQTSDWTLLGQVLEYTSDGYIQQYQKDGWAPETYTWTNGLLTEKSFNGFDWQYSYHTDNRRIHTITDIDGQVQTFTYDGIQRLKQISARNGKVIQNFSYAYTSGGDANNFVQTETIYDNDPAETNSSFDDLTVKQYMDGLGRPIQSNQQAYSPAGSDVVTATKYDAFGRPFKVYEPFEASTSNGAFVTSLPASLETDNAFTLTEYEPSPANRQIKVTPPDWYATQYEYLTNDGSETIDGISYPV
ncbi:MAG: DUF6443 domain-containing protein, partial [Bacteroidota bacterium]